MSETEYKSFGLAEVKKRLKRGEWGDPNDLGGPGFKNTKVMEIQSWIEAEENAIKAAADKREEGRRDTEVGLAKAANKLSKSANTLSKWAIGISIAAAVMSVVGFFIKG